MLGPQAAGHARRSEKLAHALAALRDGHLVEEVGDVGTCTHTRVYGSMDSGLPFKVLEALGHMIPV